MPLELIPLSEYDHIIEFFQCHPKFTPFYNSLILDKGNVLARAGWANSTFSLYRLQTATSVFYFAIREIKGLR